MPHAAIVRFIARRVARRAARRAIREAVDIRTRDGLRAEIEIGPFETTIRAPQRADSLGDLPL